MPTDHQTLGYPNDAYGLTNGTVLEPAEITLTDMDDDSDIGPGDQINGVRITASYLGDKITVDTDTGPVEIEGVTFYLSNGDKHFMATDGTVLKPGVAAGSEWVPNSTDVPLSSVTPPCFVAGTRIAVPGGVALVEDLRAGDWVETLDHGPQRLVWVGQRTLPGIGKCAPVEFAPGALGNDAPLRVSPQHRVLVRDGRLAMLFDTTETLIPACHLVDGVSVRTTPQPSVTYVHLLFARHEVVFSEGVPTESLHPGPVALDGFTQAAREELLMLMPELAEHDWAYGPCARRVLNRHEARVTGAMVLGAGFSPPEHPSCAQA
ncbi:Hint domain-containing protein [Tropicimonas sp. S265A]|uniref:Hint domain-containing protein n=1 Tax=Tropicimonas sp. S265A TaxID=3415134 RepID=UPI003C7EABDF